MIHILTKVIPRTKTRSIWTPSISFVTVCPQNPDLPILLQLWMEFSQWNQDFHRVVVGIAEGPVPQGLIPYIL